MSKTAYSSALVVSVMELDFEVLDDRTLMGGNVATAMDIACICSSSSSTTCSSSSSTCAISIEAAIAG